MKTTGPLGGAQLLTHMVAAPTLLPRLDGGAAGQPPPTSIIVENIDGSRTRVILSAVGPAVGPAVAPAVARTPAIAAAGDGSRVAVVDGELTAAAAVTVEMDVDETAVAGQEVTGTRRI